MGQDVFVRYVFLDVVSYTSRTTENQRDIVEKLQEIVRTSAKNIESNLLWPYVFDYSAFLPTGDGMCIAIKKIKEDDVGIVLGLKILENIDKHNSQNKDLPFNVRIGVNANTDIEYEDINGRNNYAGRGINLAQRIMSMGDGGNILVGSHVYETLAQRDKYHNKFIDLGDRAIKQNKVKIYQYIDKTNQYLNNEPPKKLS